MRLREILIAGSFLPDPCGVGDYLRWLRSSSSESVGQVTASALSAPQWPDLDYGDACGLSSHHASLQSYSSYY